MSGTKVSRFQLERMRAEKLALVQEVQTDHGRLKGLVQQLRTNLENASAGVRESFPQEVARVSSFLEKFRIPDVAQLDVNADKPRLDALRKQVGNLARQAAELHQVLSKAFGEKADQLGREWSQRIGEVERLLAGGHEILQLWTPAVQLDAWEHTLQLAQQKAAEQRYAELGGFVDSLAGELEGRIAWSRMQEEKHQKRRYVLNAIHDVCESRGFRRVSGPFFEKDDDRGSRIIMTFDTMAKGQIEFSLTLEGIHAESQITGSQCFEDFRDLSKRLADLYGVETEFAHPGEPKPELEEIKDAGHGQKPRTVGRTNRR